MKRQMLEVRQRGAHTGVPFTARAISMGLLLVGNVAERAAGDCATAREWVSMSPLPCNFFVTLAKGGSMKTIANLPLAHAVGLAIVWGALFAPASDAPAQDYPTKNMRIVVPFPAGATSDLLARSLAQSLGAAWKILLVVENKPGASTVIGTDLVAKSVPDGHTLLVTGAAIGVIPALMPKLPFELYKDVQPVTIIGVVPCLLLVHPSLPVKSVQELVAHAKANPGTLAFSSAGNGTIPHMGGELLKMRAGLNMTHVPYKGGADAIVALMGGQVQLSIDGGPHVLAHTKSGKLRVLALATRERLADFPNVPTIAESGFPGFESNVWQSLWVTGATPPAVVRKISEEVMRTLRTPEMTERLLAAGVTPIGNTPEVAEKFVRAETAKWGAVIKSAGIKAE
jgi:tripartite-type tricarboxylate transporter receptor subunit TctC